MTEEFNANADESEWLYEAKLKDWIEHQGRSAFKSSSIDSPQQVLQSYSHLPKQWLSLLSKNMEEKPGLGAYQPPVTTGFATKVSLEEADITCGMCAHASRRGLICQHEGQTSDSKAACCHACTSRIDAAPSPASEAEESAASQSRLLKALFTSVPDARERQIRRAKELVARDDYPPVNVIESMATFLATRWVTQN